MLFYCSLKQKRKSIGPHSTLNNDRRLYEYPSRSGNAASDNSNHGEPVRAIQCGKRKYFASDVSYILYGCWLPTPTCEWYSARCKSTITRTHWALAVSVCYCFARHRLSVGLAIAQSGRESVQTLTLDLMAHDCSFAAYGGDSFQLHFANGMRPNCVVCHRHPVKVNCGLWLRTNQTLCHDPNESTGYVFRVCAFIHQMNEQKKKMQTSPSRVLVFILVLSSTKRFQRTWTLFWFSFLFCFEIFLFSFVVASSRA